MKSIYKTIIFLLFSVSVIPVFAKTKPQHQSDMMLHLKIYLKESIPGDTIFLAVDNMVNLALGKYNNKIASGNPKGYFEFAVPLREKTGYFSLGKVRTFTDNGRKLLRSLISPCFYEAGDSLTIHLSNPETLLDTNYTATFEGRGALKYQVKEKLAMMPLHIDKKPKVPTYPFGFKGNIIQFTNFDAISDYRQRQLDLLEKYKSALPSLVYNVMRADVIYNNQVGIVKSIGSYAKDSLALKSEAFQAAFRKKYYTIYDAIDNYHITQEGLTNSLEYTIFLVVKTREAARVNIGRRSVDWSYARLKQLPNNTQTAQRIKETLITLLFLVAERDSGNALALYEDATRQVHNPEYLKMIQQLKQRTPGNDLSNYELIDLEGKSVKLGKFKGKITLIDFWFTGCGHCEYFYKNTLSKVKEIFKESEQVNFISISSDIFRDKWKKSIQSGVYTSNEAINLYTGGKGMHHPIVTDNLIRGFPCVLIVDKQGRIVIFNTQELYDSSKLTELLKTYI